MVRFRHGVKLICFCTKCGNKMSEDAMFCGKCGNKIERNFNVPEENKLFAALQPQYYASQYGMPAPAVPKKASRLKKYILIPMGIFVAVALVVETQYVFVEVAMERVNAMPATEELSVRCVLVEVECQSLPMDRTLTIG